MKNGNGYGGIVKLGGNRRKPWAIRITVGQKPNGNQIYKYLGYYENREDAIYELALYNKGGIALDAKKVTLEDVYKLWSQKIEPTVKKESFDHYVSAYNVIPENLKRKKFSELKADHFQAYMDKNGKSKSTNSFFKTMLGMIYNYAIEKDLVLKNQASFLKVSGKEAKKKKVFTDKEIKLLWEYTGEDRYDILIVLLYTGMRINELLLLEKSTVNLEEQFAIGGSKTEAGTDRIIPFCDKIMPIIRRWYDQNNKYLVEFKGRQYLYITYSGHFKKILENTKMKHTIHETRHTFISKLDSLGTSKTVIQKIVGHSGEDITEKVYTHKAVSELLEAVNKL